MGYGSLWDQRLRAPSLERRVVEPQPLLTVQGNNEEDDNHCSPFKTMMGVQDDDDEQDDSEGSEGSQCNEEIAQAQGEGDDEFWDQVSQCAFAFVPHNTSHTHHCCTHHCCIGIGVRLSNRNGLLRDREGVCPLLRFKSPALAPACLAATAGASGHKQESATLLLAKVGCHLWRPCGGVTVSAAAGPPYEARKPASHQLRSASAHTLNHRCQRHSLARGQTGVGRCTPRASQNARPPRRLILCPRWCVYAAIHTQTAVVVLGLPQPGWGRRSCTSNPLRPGCFAQHNGITRARLGSDAGLASQ